MSKFQILWNYTRKKNGEIVIAEEELQKMLDMAEKTAYNEGFMDGLKSVQTPVCHSVAIHLFSSPTLILEIPLGPER